ncbi:MAG: helix-turn-helix domain-containing protein [Betaproteobacteria bacterium]|jgi:transcriptional regulator with XRE-family HTH domain|nr:helix-turn-helix domain-containing protein [Betaproteobacteria bacterium]NBT69513.1 helix-turn-helix domain-containing protein [Betaproteobacteria bacterium]
MQIESSLLNDLANALKAERKLQKLSREEAASVCGVSASFIRDVEANPENCSLGKLVRLIGGLGLSLDVAGLQVNANSKYHQGVRQAKMSRRPDFGVSGGQLVNPRATQQPSDAVPSKSKGNQS